MQKAGFVAHCPYEVGDKIKVTLHGDLGIVGGPITDRTAEVTITDILAVHSMKHRQVAFIYEIENTRTIKLISWEAVQHGE